MEALFYLEINKLLKLFYYQEIISCIDILLNYKQRSDINLIRKYLLIHTSTEYIEHIELIWYFKQ